MGASTMIERLYTLEEVASILRVHRNTVTKYIDSGMLVASKIGKEYRISETSLRDFLKRTQKREG